MENRYLKDSVIYKRHSIRKFKQDPIDAEQIEHILHAGMAAPSAHNSQPWSFVLIDDRQLLNAIADFHPYGKMIYEASAAILACAIRSVVDKDPFYQQDLGASVENMLLAAAECGVGSCWCGVHPKAALEKSFVELLHIPETLFPFAIIALGYKKDETIASDRYSETRVQRNGW